MTKKRAWLLASYHIQDFGVKGLSELALAENKQWEILKEKKQFFKVNGLFYIQTCNRIEYLYCFNSDDVSGQDMGLLLPALTSRIYTDLGEITEHLLAVCLSKDSLVFGESQIMGQFKRAYNEAKEQQILGDDLGKLLPWILQESKKIRSKLPFRHFPSSMSALAAKKVQNNINSGDDILFIGAGETNEIVARYLNKKGYSNFHFLNRSLAKAENLAKNIAGRSYTWRDISHIKPVSAIICATSSQEILVNKDLLEKLKPNIVIDLSMPNNVCEAACRELNIDLHTVESFKNNLDQVKKDSQSFLWDLQKHIIDAKNLILRQWKIHSSAISLKSFKDHQGAYIDRIVKELKNNDASDKIITNITRELKLISHEQILDFRKSIENEESY